MNEATARHDAAAAIEVRHLSLRYGAVTVLNDVSFSVAAGSVLGVVGRNGAGKSSLLQCLLGLTVPQGGGSSLHGCSSLALTDVVKARLGYVAQTPELFDWLRVREQIALIGGLYPGWSEARASALCRRFELPDDLRVVKLSAGEKQRLAIVLALAHQPDLLVFDEPSASLDPVSAQAVAHPSSATAGTRRASRHRSTGPARRVDRAGYDAARSDTSRAIAG